MRAAAEVLEPLNIPEPAEVPDGHKQTEVGIIPEDWKTLSLGNLIKLQRGHDLTARHRRSGDVPVMGSAGQNGFHDTALVSAPGVVLGRSGASYGQAHHCPQDYWPHNTALYVTDFHDNNVLFVYYLLKSIDFSRHNSGGAQQSLNRNFIYPIVVAAPDPDEQGVIADALQDMDAWIASLGQLLEKKRLIKQGAMQDLLTGRRRLPGFSGGWEVKRLGSFGTFMKGSGVKREDAGSGPLPCVRYGELYTIHNDFVREFHTWISAEVAASARRVRRGDILFAGSGETKEEIGKCAVILQDGDAFAGGDVIVFRPASEDPLYLAYLLNSPEVQAQKAQKGQGDTIVHISATALSDMELNLPPTPEQEAIAAAIADVDNELEALEVKLEKARQIKQGMMQELLTGRLRLV